MFSFIKKAFTTIYEQVTGKLRTLFHRTSVDEDTLKELERILIEADTGIHTTRMLLDELRKEAANGTLKTGEDLEKALQVNLAKLLAIHPYNPQADVYLLVGINGSGKTTFASKLAAHLQSQGKKVLLVAADTFRAAATEQLQTWATRLSIDLITGKEEQDPDLSCLQGCEAYKEGDTNTHYRHGWPPAIQDKYL